MENQETPIQPQPPKFMAIPFNLLNEIANYLVEKPYKDVAKFLEELKMVKPINIVDAPPSSLTGGDKF